VEQAFHMIARNALQQESQQKQIYIPQTIGNLAQPQQEQSSKCC
jgi:hypothetical protein